MAFRDEFAGITQFQQSLAPFTHLHIGGPAEYVVTPRNRQELACVLLAGQREKLPLRFLGSGTSLVIRDEGVSGAVVRLVTAEFTQIVVEGNRLKAGGGATLSAIVAEATTHQLAGLETLVGIVATLGGALRCNAGDRSGEIADHVTRIEVLDDAGKVQIRNRSEIHFGDQTSDIEDPVVLSVEFALEKDRPEAIVKRMRRAWINRKATQPFSFQSAARMFKNPRGYQASTLIDQAGLARTKVGAAEVSERNANFVIAHPGTTATDVIRLLEVVQKKVHEASGVHLERELNVW